MSRVAVAGSPGFGSSGIRALLLGILASLFSVGCEISPIIRTTDEAGRFGDCERAAEAYCEQVLRVDDREVGGCIAEYRYKCVAGNPR